MNTPRLRMPPRETPEAIGWTIEYSITQKGRYAVFHHGHRVSRWMKKRSEAQRCLNANIDALFNVPLPQDEPMTVHSCVQVENLTDLFAVAYRDRNYWHLAKYPWTTSQAAAQQQVRFLETSLHYKNLHLRVVKITFLEI